MRSGDRTALLGGSSVERVCKFKLLREFVERFRGLQRLILWGLARGLHQLSSDGKRQSGSPTGRARGPQEGGRPGE